MGDAVLKMNWNVNNKTNLLLWYRTCAHNLCVPYSIFYVVLSHVQCRRKWCLKLFWCVCSGQSPRTCCTAIWLVLIPQSVERQGFRAFDLAEGISDARGLVFPKHNFWLCLCTWDNLQWMLQIWAHGRMKNLCCHSVTWIYLWPLGGRKHNKLLIVL